MVWENKQFQNLKVQYQISEAQKTNGLRLLHSMVRGERMLPATKVASFLYAYILDSFNSIDQVKMADAILEGSIDYDSPEVLAFLQDRYQRYLDACYRLYDPDRVKSAEDVIVQDLRVAKELGVDLPDDVMTIASFRKMAEEKKEESSNKIEPLGFEQFVNLLLGGKLVGPGESYAVSPSFRVLALIGLPLALIGFASGLSGKTSGLLMSLLGGAILFGLYSTLNNKYQEMQKAYYEGGTQGSGSPAHKPKPDVALNTIRRQQPQQDQLLAASVPSRAPAVPLPETKTTPVVPQQADLAKAEPKVSPIAPTAAPSVPFESPIPEPPPPTDLLAKSPAQPLSAETVNAPA